ncbi:MAG TPA: heavy metal-responsive transcriptional regulator [Pyrinomonadaceae bacterium]|jgi:DNA-binding transcriptional MerR regulator|nr:heavy metal-responsive transcriptional regulator [Pyrinomonadaceae bacterium]
MKQTASTGGPWRIGELAKAAGVSTDTLRHYERKGVLRSQRARNGYREYDESVLERVRMIRKALAIGFTLDELNAVFKVFDRGGVPCQQVRSLAASKLAQLEIHLAEVIALRDDLKDALKDWDKRLAKTASGERAGLLKALTARNGLHSSSGLLLRKPSSKKKEQKT